MTVKDILKGVVFGTAIVGTIAGFIDDKYEAKQLDDKLQEMRDIEERIKNMEK